VTTDNDTLDTSEVASFIHSSSRSVVTPTLDEAISNWHANGLPHLVKLLDELFDSKTITDPMIHTLIFNVFGGYLVNFGNAHHLNGDVVAAHYTAFDELMKDPALSSMANQFMRNAVNEQISKVVK